MDFNYIPWESEKRFWIAASELAVVQFIPFALAKWGRKWENPEDNWANVSLETWWRNISQGWEYDGDAFLTNYFAHPYHGNLYYNVGRTNGFDFWESSAWAATGSLMWEYFGETFRPSINDWVNTTLNGITLGEILYRLSNMLTDNTATGSNRVLREIGGAVLNPVRGFNRLISGETGKLFPNPVDRKPSNYLVTVDAGIRSLDKDVGGSVSLKEQVQEGLFVIDFFYGNLFTESIKKPFSNFQLTMALSSGSPSLTRIQAYGTLFGNYFYKRKNSQILFVTTLDYTYLNTPGYVYGGTSIDPKLVSRFRIGETTNIITSVGVDLVVMGATPNDYFTDEEGRNYDFGPGFGLNLKGSLKSGIWDYVDIFYATRWLYTQSEPAESRHHLHLILVSAHLPIKNYFAIGLGIGAYWRNSYYENFDDVFLKSPILRVFFKTALHY
ncbi:MAG: DUF3943 domain-containing protein [Ignavibacteriaceae bacterium]|nr:DUF3943 domain-containing protein [Ignavibacteriaceae bacterium]